MNVALKNGHHLNRVEQWAILAYHTGRSKGFIRGCKFIRLQVALALMFERVYKIDAICPHKVYSLRTL